MHLRLHQREVSRHRPGDRIGNISAETLRAKPNGSQDAISGQPRVSLHKLLDRPARPHLLKDVFDGNAGACNDRLAHHHLWIYLDSLGCHYSTSSLSPPQFTPEQAKRTPERSWVLRCICINASVCTMTAADEAVTGRRKGHAQTDHNVE